MDNGPHAHGKCRQRKTLIGHLDVSLASPKPSFKMIIKRFFDGDENAVLKSARFDFPSCRA